ncbi:MAG: DNA replication and repair protein RecF [Thermoleophilia bacterium]|nr:DNA replication and repair protein RecF [Thermoleophilia bacterium]
MVDSVHLRAFRSWRKLDLRLEPGLVLVVGPNGAGKTNLLEALHVATQGFSPRARSDALLVRFGAEAARVLVRGHDGRAPFESEVTLRRCAPRTARLNGASLPSSAALRHGLRTLVFTPDRLAIVKGSPAIRRAFLDRVVERLYPARAEAVAEYAHALTQRNAALRRVAAGVSDEAALRPWTERLASAGRELVAARRAAVAALERPFAECACRLGLSDATIDYRGDPVAVEELDERLRTDLERGATGLGPHLHDLSIASGDRELRAFGSQGEQRMAVLALVLAEARVLTTREEGPPLLLLDDVLSELDDDRRSALVELLAGLGQTIATATARSLLPASPAQTVVVDAEGHVR